MLLHHHTILSHRKVYILTKLNLARSLGYFNTTPLLNGAELRDVFPYIQPHLTWQRLSTPSGVNNAHLSAKHSLEPTSTIPFPCSIVVQVARLLLSRANSSLSPPFPFAPALRLRARSIVAFTCVDRFATRLSACSGIKIGCHYSLT